MKKKIVITGKKVVDVGYHPFLLGMAESLEIKRFFADNTVIRGKNAVYALVDSSEKKVSEFLRATSSNFPENALVEKIAEEDYEGNVMKAENYYRYLSATQLSKIATYGGEMLEKQDDLKSALQSGFADLKEEHIKTRELSKEIFYAEVQELRRELESLRNTVEEIRRKVEAL